MTSSYPVIYERGDDGTVSAYAPELQPGAVVSTGPRLGRSPQNDADAILLLRRDAQHRSGNLSVAGTLRSRPKSQASRPVQAIPGYPVVCGSANSRLHRYLHPLGRIFPRIREIVAVVPPFFAAGFRFTLAGLILYYGAASPAHFPRPAPALRRLHPRLIHVHLPLRRTLLGRNPHRLPA